MTFDERVAALAPLGFTPRQTRFLVMAALHSGYCLRRQYLAFAGVRYGKNVRDILEALVRRELAQRFLYQPNRRFEDARQQRPRVADRLPSGLLPECVGDELLNVQLADVPKPPFTPVGEHVLGRPSKDLTSQVALSDECPLGSTWMIARRVHAA